ncbi:hypothetical protein GCM10010274_49950 [Streptomyces lavendofoliae]|uniref:Uncharacterized protein n=2 Tax=Streptomyces lavendofoliae TaxID=67314 RepID=A0A918I1N1_9ACTN|nr:hypothetical protein GCM10010274_49950 [Streptomyces lavendofoliae]
MVVLAVVSAAGLVLDDRVVVGAPVWSKPLKFSVSFVAYCLSLAWMLSLLPRFRRTGWWAGTVVVVAGAVEMVVITGQAVRGKRSHFNRETPFDAALFDVMGATIVALWVATLVVAVLLFRTPLADRASAWAIRLSTVLTLTGAGLGFLMTLPSPGQRDSASDTVGAHSVGVPDGGPGMPLTGWSTTGGDLRVPHFVGMHALQVLPLVALLLLAMAPRLTRLRDERLRLRLVLVASAAYAAVLALLTWQALRGQPLVHPDGVTLTAAALASAVIATATGAALRRPAPNPSSPPAPMHPTPREREHAA